MMSYIAPQTSYFEGWVQFSDRLSNKNNIFRSYKHPPKDKFLLARLKKLRNVKGIFEPIVHWQIILYKKNPLLMD